jgi:hypothetical protein
VLAVVMTLAALSVAAQTHITSSVSARALHSQTGAPDYFEDSDYAGVEGAGPFGRLRVSVDSDGDAQIYNAAASAWAQVSTGGVHAYTRSQSNSSTVEQTWTHRRGEAMGLIDDSFALLVSSAPVGTLFNVTAQARRRDRLGDGARKCRGQQQRSPRLQRLGVVDTAQHHRHGDIAGRVESLTGLCLPTHHTCVGEGATGLQTISFQMSNGGTTLQLRLGVWSWAGTSNYQLHEGMLTSDSESNLGHTVAWASVTELRDAGGVLFADY